MEHYEAQAEEFLKRHSLTLRVAFKGCQCPPWDDDGHIHGDCYRVTIKRPSGRSLSFDFWNSLYDAQQGKEPGPYDILACLSSDIDVPTDIDEIAAELGPMKPSRAIAIARFSQRLRNFFTEDEQEELTEIL
jgi:hypothetical protein